MKKLTVFMFFVVLLSPVFAQELEVFSTEEGAIRGYDPVAYFKEGKPVKGKSDWVYQWNGASWYFSTQENMTMFESAPEKFAPQYGGFCAYGMSDGDGHKATTQPDAWTIVNDKLYLNYNKNVKTLWVKDQKMMIENADKNWPVVKSTKLE
jgi:YHS domain-containing protein